MRWGALLGLSRFRWFRRWRGGHWERWIIEYAGSAGGWEEWMQMPWCLARRGQRPAFGRGTPTCEDYGGNA